MAGQWVDRLGAALDAADVHEPHGTLRKGPKCQYPCAQMRLRGPEGATMAETLQ